MNAPSCEVLGIALSAFDCAVLTPDLSAFDWAVLAFAFVFSFAVGMYNIQHRQRLDEVESLVAEARNTMSLSDEEYMAAREAALSEVTRLKYNDQSAGTKDGIVPPLRPVWAILVNPRRTN